MAVAADASAAASVASGGAMAAEAEAEAEETVDVSGGGLHEHTMRAGVSMCTRVGARAGRAWFEG